MRYFIYVFFIAFYSLNAMAQEGWVTISSPLHVEINKVCDYNDSTLLAATNQGVYLLNTRTSIWNYLGLADSIFFIKPLYTIIKVENIIITAGMGYIYKSVDFGEKWDTVLDVLDNIISLYKTNEGIILAGGREHIYHSEDTGNTWQISIGINQGGTTAIEGFIDNNPRLFTVAKDYMCSVGGIYYSDDGGHTWLFSGLKNLSVEEIERNSKGDLYVATVSEGFFISSDNGEHWDKIECFIPVRGMVVDPNERIWVGYNDITKSPWGVYYSDNEGQSWIKMSDPIQTFLVNDLYLSRRKYLYAISSYSDEYPSLFRYEIPLGISLKESIFRFQACPNPTSDKITIIFSNSSKHILTLYSLQGYVILHNTFYGEYTQLDLSHFSPGFYILKEENNTEIESILIIKK